MKVGKLARGFTWAMGLFGLGLIPALAASPEVGVTRMEVPASPDGRSLSVTVWYPAASKGETVVLGESPFFAGTPAELDAPIADGRFPLVLLSHGAGLAGQAEAMSWIAAPLAERGFVVAAPTHPGNGGPNRSAAETMRLWLRPSDISRTLDAVAVDRRFVSHLRLEAVGVLGLSMGGGTAVAGARFDPERLATYCDVLARNPSLCGWVRGSGVDLHALDMEGADRDRRDESIRFAMAIDPAPVDVFDPASLPTIGIPVELMNLGRADAIPATADASTIAAAIPGASYSVIKDASHFSMFGICKPGAERTALEAEIEEAICFDGTGTSRSAIHAALVDRVEAAFREGLGRAVQGLRPRPQRRTTEVVVSNGATK